MYDSFYKLAEKPFQISTDPRFLWRGEKHREALANLQYGLLDRNGFVVLTGDVGTGKTTLVNAMLETLDDRVCIAKINHPSLDVIDFLRLLAKTFDPSVTAPNKSDLLLFFDLFLHQMYAEGKIVLLIIDEAHRLSIELLEEIRLLSNIEEAGKRLLNIIFVGQNELKPILLLPQCRALRQRITLFFEIQTLTCEETLEYVEYRLKVSGVQDKLFTQAAIQKIHAHAKGNPRMINILCDRALLTGFVKERKEIDADIINECNRELSLGDSAKFTLQGVRSAITGRGVQSSPSQQPGGVQASYMRPTSERESFISRLFLPAGHFIKRNRNKIITSLLAAGIAFAFLSLTIGAHKAAVLKDNRSAASNKSNLTSRQPPSKPTQQPSDSKMPEDSLQKHGGPTSSPVVSEENADLDQQGEARVPTSPPPMDDNSPSTSKPDSALLTSATAALEQKNYQKAVELLEAFQSAHPDQKSNRLYSQALVGRAGELLTSSPSEAETMLLKAAAADPSANDAFMLLGKFYMRTKNYEKAIAYYQQAVRLDPEAADAFFNLGFAYAAIDKYKASEKAFKQVVRLKPPYLAKSLFNLAVVQQKIGKRMESIANLETAASIEPESQKIQSYLKNLKALTTADAAEQGQ